MVGARTAAVQFTMLCNMHTDATFATDKNSCAKCRCTKWPPTGKWFIHTKPAMSMRHTYEQRTLTSYLSHSSDNSNFCILLTPTTAGKKKNLHLNIAIMPPTFCLCSFGPLCRRQYANAGFLCVATISATTADLWPPFHREICKSIIALNLIST